MWLVLKVFGAQRDPLALTISGPYLAWTCHKVGMWFPRVKNTIAPHPMHQKLIAFVGLAVASYEFHLHDWCKGVLGVAI